MKKRTAATAAILACTMMFSGCSDSILTSGTDSDLSNYRKTVRQELLTSRQSEKTNAILEEWRSAVNYEYDYEKLNITKEEKTSSDASASSADSKADNETSSAASSGTTTSE